MTHSVWHVGGSVPKRASRHQVGRVTKTLDSP